MRDSKPIPNLFLASWREREITEAALLYGSYAVGIPRSDSDLDLLILLRDDSPSQPPVLDYIDGILIEVFFLTPNHVREFWAIHHSQNTHVSAVQWVDGKILFDRHDIAATLQREASEWIEKPFNRLSREALYWPVRSLWQGAEHLRSLARRDDPSVVFFGMSHLDKLYSTYAKAIGEPIIEPHKLHRYLTDPALRSRYHMPPFPDADFASKLTQLLTTSSNAQWLRQLLQLTSDVIDRVGGFAPPALAKSTDSSNHLC